MSEAEDPEEPEAAPEPGFPLRHQLCAAIDPRRFLFAGTGRQRGLLWVVEDGDFESAEAVGLSDPSWCAEDDLIELIPSPHGTLLLLRLAQSAYLAELPEYGGGLYNMNSSPLSEVEWGDITEVHWHPACPGDDCLIVLNGGVELSILSVHNRGIPLCNVKLISAVREASDVTCTALSPVPAEEAQEGSLGPFFCFVGFSDGAIELAVPLVPPEATMSARQVTTLLARYPDDPLGLVDRLEGGAQALAAEAISREEYLRTRSEQPGDEPALLRIAVLEEPVVALRAAAAQEATAGPGGAVFQDNYVVCSLTAGRASVHVVAGASVLGCLLSGEDVCVAPRSYSIPLETPRHAPKWSAADNKSRFLFFSSSEDPGMVLAAHPVALLQFDVSRSGTISVLRQEDPLSIWHRDGPCSPVCGAACFRDVRPELQFALLRALGTTSQLTMQLDHCDLPAAAAPAGSDGAPGAAVGVVAAGAAAAAAPAPPSAAAAGAAAGALSAPPAASWLHEWYSAEEGSRVLPRRQRILAADAVAAFCFRHRPHAGSGGSDLRRRFFELRAQRDAARACRTALSDCVAALQAAAQEKKQELEEMKRTAAEIRSSLTAARERTTEVLRRLRSPVGKWDYGKGVYTISQEGPHYVFSEGAVQAVLEPDPDKDGLGWTADMGERGKMFLHIVQLHMTTEMMVSCLEKEGLKPRVGRARRRLAPADSGLWALQAAEARVEAVVSDFLRAVIVDPDIARIRSEAEACRVDAGPIVAAAGQEGVVMREPEEHPDRAPLCLVALADGSCLEDVPEGALLTVREPTAEQRLRQAVGALEADRKGLAGTRDVLRSVFDGEQHIEQLVSRLAGDPPGDGAAAPREP